MRGFTTFSISLEKAEDVTDKLIEKYLDLVHRYACVKSLHATRVRGRRLVSTCSCVYTASLGGIVEAGRYNMHVGGAGRRSVRNFLFPGC
jgi:hypothetical protein